MYDIIQMTPPSTAKAKSLMESFDLNSTDYSMVDFNEAVFTEAVFENGREQIQPIIDSFAKLKKILEDEIKVQDEGVEEADRKNGGRPAPYNSPRYKNVKWFDPKEYWRNQEFKNLEDIIAKTFGFRDVSVEPYIEKYYSREKMFQSRKLNAEVWHSDRFPIQGLVTDKGFYDKSKSIRMNVYITLGIIKALTPEEITAALMHEFGHSIDPATVNISYVETNALAKYLTDRKGAINKQESKALKEIGPIKMLMHLTSKVAKDTYRNIRSLGTIILDFITGGKYSEARKKKLLNRISVALKKDNTIFGRQEYGEAFADNFARMYGLGAPLASMLKKIEEDFSHRVRSWYALENSRQQLIISMTIDMINDCHKTDLHRIHALLKEYREDLKDPNISTQAKKHMEEDMKILEDVLKSYTEDFDEMQNRAYQLIDEDLKKKYHLDDDYNEIEDKDDKKK